MKKKFIIGGTIIFILTILAIIIVLILNRSPYRLNNIDSSNPLTNTDYEKSILSYISKSDFDGYTYGNSEDERYYFY